MPRARQEATRISRYYGPCVWVTCLPSAQAIVPHRGGSILRSILKVQLLKSHVFGQIIVDLSQFRVSCYKFDVILKLRNFPKPYVNYKTIHRFIFKLLALKRVRSFFFCGVYYTNDITADVNCFNSDISIVQSLLIAVYISFSSL